VREQRDAFDAWAPERSHWSDWAKPVLFWAKGDKSARREPLPLVRTEIPRLRAGAVLVVNLPGAAGITYALAAAQSGYRPVPLYNCGVGPQPLVPTEPIRRALIKHAPELDALVLSNDAPPAFLLDSNRQRGVRKRAPGRFDNRWIVFPQDFPSATLLRSRGFRRAVLVQAGSTAVDDDLAHVLSRWQEAGIGISLLDLQTDRPPQPLQLRKPWGFRSLWYTALAAVGFMRGAAGGFGAVIPQSSGGAG
jgi:hypothetical protein